MEKTEEKIKEMERVQKVLEEDIRKFDEDVGLCKYFGNHPCGPHKTPYGKLMKMIADEICVSEFGYHRWSRHKFHRETASSIAYKLTKNWRAKLRWAWIILIS